MAIFKEKFRDPSYSKAENSGKMKKKQEEGGRRRKEERKLQFLRKIRFLEDYQALEGEFLLFG